MKTINALCLRNNLGKVLQELEETKEPILVGKGGKVRAALVGIDDFQKRFVDKQEEEDDERDRAEGREIRRPGAHQLRCHVRRPLGGSRRRTCIRLGDLVERLLPAAPPEGVEARSQNLGGCKQVTASCFSPARPDNPIGSGYSVICE
jgi:PHD/YefM family antitoxin component YafN of YafNO toxin-antitoxin module